MYDVTDKNTFLKLETWLEELNTYCNKIDIVKMIVGNKIDLPNREVTTDEGLTFARRHQTLYIESSAKTADGVKCCFEELVQKVFIRRTKFIIICFFFLWETIVDKMFVFFFSFLFKIIQTPGLWEQNYSMRMQNIGGNGPRQRFGKQGLQLTDDYTASETYSNCYC